MLSQLCVLLIYVSEALSMNSILNCIVFILCVCMWCSDLRFVCALKSSPKWDNQTKNPTQLSPEWGGKSEKPKQHIFHAIDMNLKK